MASVPPTVVEPWVTFGPRSHFLWWASGRLSVSTIPRSRIPPLTASRTSLPTILTSVNVFHRACLRALHEEFSINVWSICYSTGLPSPSTISLSEFRWYRHMLPLLPRVLSLGPHQLLTCRRKDIYWIGPSAIFMKCLENASYMTITGCMCSNSRN